jgi:hypothetical protein
MDDVERMGYSKWFLENLRVNAVLFTAKINLRQEAANSLDALKKNPPPKPG